MHFNGFLTFNLENVQTSCCFAQKKALEISSVDNKRLKSLFSSPLYAVIIVL